ncbi:hypothetical protein O53_446 [Microcystis aeruginosa TAIHU98]|uniref:Uncharacterized protein n=1 Tax=Microcystis aeruginosa TAIHU98 TaxID=1134457 RepID=L7EC24_MICAE|nr:hypothetical protein O53_446 [Microcystis aeruginosa TAIHU98]ODV37349.1 hypothetical protein BFG60_3249 [Microcystis aeruginosa NIES-98]
MAEKIFPRGRVWGVGWWGGGVLTPINSPPSRKKNRLDD